MIKYIRNYWWYISALITYLLYALEMSIVLIIKYDYPIVICLRNIYAYWYTWMNQFNNKLHHIIRLFSVRYVNYDSDKIYYRGNIEVLSELFLFTVKVNYRCLHQKKIIKIYCKKKEIQIEWKLLVFQFYYISD